MHACFSSVRVDHFSTIRRPWRPIPSIILIFDRQFVHGRCPETLRLVSGIYLMRQWGERIIFQCSVKRRISTKVADWRTRTYSFKQLPTFKISALIGEARRPEIGKPLRVHVRNLKLRLQHTMPEVVLQRVLVGRSQAFDRDIQCSLQLSCVSVT